ncbi:MAG: transglycosylase SLT domain-containing protein [Beijerinckiaceae bacterium]
MRRFGPKTFFGISVLAMAAAAPMLGYGPERLGLHVPGLADKPSAKPEPIAAPVSEPAPLAVAAEKSLAQADAPAQAQAPAEAIAPPEAPPEAKPAVVAALTPLPGPASAVDAIATATAPAGPPAATDAPAATAYAPAAAPEASPSRPAIADAIAPPLPERADAAALRAAIAAYRAGDLDKGDEAARDALDDLGRTTLEWAALRLQAKAAGYTRLAAFIDRNPDWPTSGFLQARLEDALYVSKASAPVIRERFANKAPTTTSGRIALARAHLAAGKTKDAAALVKQAWREDDFGSWTEGAIRKEFGEILNDADHKARSARLFYKGQHAASMRAAELVNKDYVALARARTAVHREAKADKLMGAVPPALREDPTYMFARIQILRRANKHAEAAELLGKLKDSKDLVEPGAWWAERRMIARRLLDAGEPKLAYKVAADHPAIAGEDLIDAEFHAGWISLRFVGDAETASRHFAAAAGVARTPISQARTLYWQGRAAEARELTDEANAFYRQAAEHSSAYYGQLARARLGLEEQPVRRARDMAQGDQRLPAIRAIEVFEAIGEKELAFRLTIDLARTLEDETQIAALGQILVRAKDARATLIVGKLASQRGVALDDVAFPTFGVPDFEELARAAERPVVFAIARQESAFQPDAVSHAGAKGLMQMLTSTARVTAKRAGVPFDERRLLTDPAFNAQLGSAHLSELMDDHGNSLILTFAAYNAGGPRVRQWIAAYGDPRKADVDPIDWVERIPFTETRNYVQRVAENLAMYRARFGAPDAPALAARDLRAREARLVNKAN